MQTPDEIRAARHSIYEDAARMSRDKGDEPLTQEDIAYTARTAGMAAALNWVLGKEERPDWDFLDTIADPPAADR